MPTLASLKTEIDELRIEVQENDPAQALGSYSARLADVESKLDDFIAFVVSAIGKEFTRA